MLFYQVAGDCEVFIFLASPVMSSSVRPARVSERDLVAAFLASQLFVKETTPKRKEKDSYNSAPHAKTSSLS